MSAVIRQIETPINPFVKMLWEKGSLYEAEVIDETAHRLPAPWRVEQTPDGYKVLDANGQALAYVYARGSKACAT